MDDQYRACDLTRRWRSDLSTGPLCGRQRGQRQRQGPRDRRRGLKAFATEGEPPKPVALTARYAFMGHEHGAGG